MVATNFSSITHLCLDWGEKDKQICLSSCLERPGIAVQEESEMSGRLNTASVPGLATAAVWVH